MNSPTPDPFRRPALLASALILCLTASTALAQGPFNPNPKEPPMMKGEGWTVETIFTVSETINGYQAPGILDGIAVYPEFGNRGRVLVNHELNPGNGYAYTLANGTQLTGARVSTFIVRRLPNGENVIESAGSSYDTIYDRSGNVVTDPAQVNETGNAIDGFARFCSSAGYRAGQFGFVDDVYFTGEETSKPFHPHGGTEWVIDVANGDIWAIPALGRGAWENVTAVDTGDPSRVALLLGDDKESAPLYLYVGQKNGVGDMSFLDRNGLKMGQLYVWVADNGDLTPQQFNGEGSTRTGTFQPITIQDVSMAGMAGYDAAGYLDGDTLRAAADGMGAFSFSRPEDLHTNPADGTQAVFASTGRGGLFPADNWGTTYICDLDFTAMPVITCSLEIIHDADDLPEPDAGIRSPDNLVWADNGLIYIQEDRSTSPSSLFGGTTGIEASLWELNPVSLERKRIATVDRSIVRPIGATDIGAGSIGNWETSGVLDVTSVFDTKPGEVLLIGAVQAHGIRDGAIGDNPLLDEGGQLIFVRKEAVMLKGDTAATGNGWSVEEIFTVSETFGNYQPPGILDGIAAYPAFGNRAEVLVNHELNPGNGYAYTLANGTQLTGARVSRFIINRTGGVNIVETADLAYDTIYDRNGMIVTDPAQVNETGNAIDGLARFCSSAGYRAGEYGFVDDVYFTGEETSKPFHPHGGTEWVIDVDARELWAVPAFGRGAWENVTAIDSGDPTTVALLLGDDKESAPLYLYVGQKNGVGDQSFLDRNGLKMGQVYVWVADNGDLTPQQFNGEGQVRTGTFQPIAIRDVSMAGMTGYDAAGYLDGDTLRTAADAMGAFSFSRPEDLHTNPADGNQVVFASTGRGGLFPADNWGTTYICDVDFNGAPTPLCTLTIIHDADDRLVPDAGIRSPDNLVWAGNGLIYIQEDRSTSPGSLFGGTTGIEASVWQLNPVTGETLRIAEVDRSVVRPLDATDIGAGSIGNWETSGILDVTDLFETGSDTLLIANVQAHGIRDGSIGDNPLLDEGGQLVFLRNEGFSHTLTCSNVPNGVDFGFEVKNGKPGRQYLFAATAVNVGGAPDGWFFGIDIALFELVTFFNPPFLGTLDGNGRASFTFNLPGANCPLGIALDCVAIEFSSPGIVSRSSRATTTNL